VLLVGVVGLQVPHFGGGVGEGAPAVVALVRFLPAVDQLVPLQVAGGGEELAAVVAAVLGLPRVPFLVEVQQADEAVALPALLAAVGLQRAVEEMGPSRWGRRTSVPSSTTPATPVGIPRDISKRCEREGEGKTINLLQAHLTAPTDFTRIPPLAEKAMFFKHCQHLSAAGAVQTRCQELPTLRRRPLRTGASGTGCLYQPRVQTLVPSASSQVFLRPPSLARWHLSVTSAAVPVRLLVGFAGRRVGEGFVTLPAGEGLLAGVDTDVPLEVTGVGELLPAVLGNVERQAVTPGVPEGPETRRGAVAGLTSHLCVTEP